MDCNITLNYARELMRMCQTYHTCTGCPLRLVKNCLDVVGINSYRIEAVQKWSDSNPEPLKK